MSKDYYHLKDSPPHWPNYSTYFLTDSTFLHFPYFNSDTKKLIVLNQIKKLNTKLKISVSAYSIAKNHYHVKFYLKNGLLLSKAKQLLRGGISYEYNKEYEKPYKEMWQTLKTIVITSESMNWKVSGYVIGNLLKHREVSTFSELKENEYSSFWYMTEKYSYEEMIDLVKRAIVVDEDAEGGIDFKKLNNLNI